MIIKTDLSYYNVYPYKKVKEIYSKVENEIEMGMKFVILSMY